MARGHWGRDLGSFCRQVKSVGRILLINLLDSAFFLFHRNSLYILDINPSARNIFFSLCSFAFNLFMVSFEKQKFFIFLSILLIISFMLHILRNFSVLWGHDYIFLYCILNIFLTVTCRYLIQIKLNIYTIR